MSSVIQLLKLLVTQRQDKMRSIDAPLQCCTTKMQHRPGRAKSDFPKGEEPKAQPQKPIQSLRGVANRRRGWRPRPCLGCAHHRGRQWRPLGPVLQNLGDLRDVTMSGSKFRACHHGVEECRLLRAGRHRGLRRSGLPCGWANPNIRSGAAVVAV